MDPQAGGPDESPAPRTGGNEDRTEVLMRIGSEPGPLPGGQGGPEGPEGPDGPDGPEGPSGPGGPEEPGKKVKKQRSRRVRYARRTAFTMLGILGFSAIVFAVAYLLTPVPSARSASTASGPTFYYSDGTTVIAHQGINRQLVDLDKVPPSVRMAVLSAENRTFYSDPGVSLKSTARAVWSTVSGSQVQGGSTITQQMVR